MSKSTTAIANTIALIQQADRLQAEMRETFKDDNVLYYVYDRNQLIRATDATYNPDSKYPKGTCAIESRIHAISMEAKGYKPRMFQAKIKNKFGKVINHCYLTIEINGKTYHEGRGNGLHKRTPLWSWQEANDVITQEELEL